MHPNRNFSYRKLAETIRAPAAAVKSIKNAAWIKHPRIKSRGFKSIITADDLTINHPVYSMPTQSSSQTGTVTESIRGIVDRVTYHNPDNGWSVLRVLSFNNPHQQETVIVHQTKVFAGATMEFHGAWTIHPKFGRQFKAIKAVERKLFNLLNQEERYDSWFWCNSRR